MVSDPLSMMSMVTFLVDFMVNFSVILSMVVKVMVIPAMLMSLVMTMVTRRMTMMVYISMVLSMVFEVMYQQELPVMFFLHISFMEFTVVIFLVGIPMMPQAMHLTMELSTSFPTVVL